MLFVNIGQEERAIQFLAKRGEEAVLLKFSLKKTFENKIRNDAVPQRLGRLHPGRPQVVDPTKAMDQYGIPKEYFKELLENIDPQSVEVIKNTK